MKPNEITHQIIGAAIDVHRELGPGQNEVLYEDATEFRKELTVHTEFERTQSQDDLIEAIIGAAINVHRYLGPGLLNSIYEVCLRH